MKTTLTEILETLEETFKDCQSDLKSNWIEENPKLELQNDIAILRQAMSLLSDLQKHGCNQFFNNIEK